MSKSGAINRGCAVVYGAIYALAVVCAGTSGGMAFVLPVVLGFPWTLLLGLLILVPQIPTPLTVSVLLVVPPAINLFLILRSRGIVRDPGELPTETHHSLEGR